MIVAERVGAERDGVVVTFDEVMQVRDVLLDMACLDDTIWPIDVIHSEIVKETGLPALTATEALRAWESIGGLNRGADHLVEIDYDRVLIDRVHQPVGPEAVAADEEVRVAAARLCHLGAGWIDIDDIVDLLTDPIDQGCGVSEELAQDLVDELADLGVLQVQEFSVFVDRAAAADVGLWGLTDIQRAQLGHGTIVVNETATPDDVVTAAARALHALVLSSSTSVMTRMTTNELVRVVTGTAQPAAMTDKLIAAGAIVTHRGHCRLHRERLAVIADAHTCDPATPAGFIEGCAARLATLPAGACLDGHAAICVPAVMLGFWSYGQSSYDPHDYLLRLFAADGLITGNVTQGYTLDNPALRTFARQGRHTSDHAAEYDFVEYVLSRRGDSDRPAGITVVEPRCICAYEPDACLTHRDNLVEPRILTRPHLELP